MNQKESNLFISIKLTFIYLNNLLKNSYFEIYILRIRNEKINILILREIIKNQINLLYLNNLIEREDFKNGIFVNYYTNPR